MPPPAASDLALAPGVHAARVDDDLVFLDVTRGAYSCLLAAAPDLSFGPGRRVRLADPVLAAELTAAGLLAAAGPQNSCVPLRTAEPASASALRWGYAAPRPADLAPLAIAVADALNGYRGRPLARLLSPPAHDLPRTEADDPALRAAVDAFHRWIPFAPLSGKCLLRSFVLRRMLARRGLGVDWVFGVATWPFSAHCWLQAGGLVLDDTVERAASYTPILVA